MVANRAHYELSNAGFGLKIGPFLSKIQTLLWKKTRLFTVLISNIKQTAHVFTIADMLQFMNCTRNRNPGHGLGLI